GSETLIEALVGAIGKIGGEIRLGAPVTQIASAEGHVTGVELEGSVQPFDAVICTVPTPFVSALVPGLPDASKAMYEAIRNIGVVCVVLKLARPVTQH